MQALHEVQQRSVHHLAELQRVHSQVGLIPQTKPRKGCLRSGLSNSAQALLLEELQRMSWGCWLARKPCLEWQMPTRLDMPVPAGWLWLAYTQWEGRRVPQLHAVMTVRVGVLVAWTAGLPS